MRLRLFGKIFTIEARKRMAYRTDFWINSVVGILVNFSVFWFLTHAMFAASGRATLGGYTPRGMVLYYVFVILMAKIVQSNEMEMGVAQDIYEGYLNRYLIYPVPYFGMKYAEQAGWLAPQIIQLCIFGVLGPFVIGVPEEIRITPTSVVMSFVSLVLANLLHYFIIFPIHAVAFWADNVWSLVVAERIAIGFLGGLLFPLNLLPGWASDLLSWLPFPYLFSVPARVLMGDVNTADWLAGLAIAAAWCFVMAGVGRLVWRRGDLQYTGVGI
jgi:ABC-2 type transport system permease protein